MSSKRILLIHDDRILTNLFREKFEGSGFLVDSTRNVEQVPKLIEQKRPDLVLIDVVLSSGSGLDLIRSLRQSPATLETPIVLFPTALSQFSTAALGAGASKIIARNNHPIASVIDAVKTTLGMDGLGDALDAPIFQPDETWTDEIRRSSIESINQMRLCLPGLISTPPDFKLLTTLWSLVHCFSERSQLLPGKSLAQFSASFDLLMSDLHEMPEQLNGSTLRTVGQAIDFLGVLATGTGVSVVRDPSAARILVVDDEESARQFITAAMQMAGLKTETAESPSAAMEKLNGHPKDLIFLDVGLPEMTGFDLCQKIRGIELHKKTPLVFLTGMATFQNKAQASLSGGNDFVGKPFNLPELGVKATMWLLRGQMGLV